MSEDRFEPQHLTKGSAFIMTPAWMWPPFHNLDELVKTINVFKTKKVPEPTTLRDRTEYRVEAVTVERKLEEDIR